MPAQTKTNFDRIAKERTRVSNLTAANWLVNHIGVCVRTLSALADYGRLAPAGGLASRYLDVHLIREARGVLQTAVKGHDARTIARSEDAAKSRLLGQTYFQLSRASVGNRDAQVKHATLSFYLNPSVGYGKQIARIIAPEKFDGRPKGDFDNRFREGTLRRLRQERRAWLAGK